MDSIQIASVLSSHSITRRYFGGVYPCDGLPEKVLDKAYVVNVDDRRSLGTHWIGIFFKEGGEAYYFDSFGLPPIKKEFEIFLNDNCNKWYWNTKQLQEFGSDVCGHYCIHFLIHCCLGYDLTSFQKLYPQIPRQNDLLVRDVISKL